MYNSRGPAGEAYCRKYRAFLGPYPHQTQFLLHHAELPHDPPRKTHQWVRMPVPYTDEKGRSRVRDESFLVDREYKDLELKMEVDFSKGKVVAFETISSN